MTASLQFPNGYEAGLGTTSVGLEMVQIAMLRQIKNRFQNELERQALEWDAIDKQVAQEFGHPYRKARLERIKSWYPGTRLGILGMPWDTFPALAVMSDQATPSPESGAFDQSTRAYAPQLYVEALLRSDPFEQAEPSTDEQSAERVVQEGILDRRSKRTLEAIVQCIEADPTIGGIIPELPAPQVGQTDAFVLPGQEPGDQSKKRVFSLVRIQYTLDIYASRPNASQPAANVLPGLLG
jgi:hypothetical protein